MSRRVVITFHTDNERMIAQMRVIQIDHCYFAVRAPACAASFRILPPSARCIALIMEWCYSVPLLCLGQWRLSVHDAKSRGDVISCT